MGKIQKNLNENRLLIIVTGFNEQSKSDTPEGKKDSKIIFTSLIQDFFKNAKIIYFNLEEKELEEIKESLINIYIENYNYYMLKNNVGKKIELLKNLLTDLNIYAIPLIEKKKI